MKTKFKRLISVLSALCIILMMIPMTAMTVAAAEVKLDFNKYTEWTTDTDPGNPFIDGGYAISYVGGNKNTIHGAQYGGNDNSNSIYFGNTTTATTPIPTITIKKSGYKSFKFSSVYVYSKASNVTLIATGYNGETPVGTSEFLAGGPNSIIEKTKFIRGLYNVDRVTITSSDTTSMTDLLYCFFDDFVFNAPTLTAPTIALSANPKDGGLSYEITPVSGETSYIDSYTIQMYDSTGTTQVGADITTATTTGKIPLSTNIVEGTEYKACVMAVTNNGDSFSDSAYGGLCSAVKAVGKDTMPPIVSGVDDGGVYNIIAPHFNEGTATLTKDNGTARTYNSNETISDKGSYVLIVTDAAGNSTTVNFSIASKPDAPSITASNIGNGTVTINFAAPDDGGSPILDYTYEAVPTAGGSSITETGTATSHTFTGLTNGTEYSFTVTARNTFGTSASSTAVKATPNNTANDITSFKIGESVGTISGTNISVTVPFGTDVTNLTPTIGLSAGATVSPASGTAQDFTNSVDYIVKAQNGDKQTYTVTVKIASQTAPPVVTTVPTTNASTTTDSTTNAPTTTTTTTTAVTTTAETQPEPKIGGTSGWTKLEEKILKTDSGDEIYINMNGTTTVPKNIISDFMGKDVNVELDFGIYSWEINGNDITSAQNVDLGLTYTPNVVSQDVVDGVAGNSPVIQLQLNHNGSFGFTGKLTVQLPAGMAGQYANLYYYNPETNKLELYASALIGTNGTATFNFTHASDYVVVMEKTAKSQNISAGAGATDNAEPITANGLPYVVIAAGLAVGIIAVKKRKIKK